MRSLFYRPRRTTVTDTRVSPSPVGRRFSGGFASVSPSPKRRRLSGGVASVSALLLGLWCPTAMAARCIGANPCRACTSYRYCKLCSIYGRKCGVCAVSPSLTPVVSINAVYSTPPAKPHARTTNSNSSPTPSGRRLSGGKASAEPTPYRERCVGVEDPSPKGVG